MDDTLVLATIISNTNVTFWLCIFIIFILIILFIVIIVYVAGPIVSLTTTVEQFQPQINQLIGNLNSLQALIERLSRYLPTSTAMESLQQSINSYNAQVSTVPQPMNAAYPGVTSRVKNRISGHTTPRC